MMKYIITENKLRNIIKKEFGVDFDVEVITSKSQIPNEFYSGVPPNLGKRILEHEGIIYLMKTEGDSFLILPLRGNKYPIVSSKWGWVDEKRFFDLLGIPSFISASDLINAFIPKQD